MVRYASEPFKPLSPKPEVPVPKRITVSKALREAKKLKGEIGVLDARLASCVSWSGDEKPEFDFAETRALRASKVEALTALKTKIACSNAVTQVEVEGRSMTVTEAIRRMEETSGELKLIERLPLERRGTRLAHTGAYDDRSRPVMAPVQFHSALSEVERAAEVTALKARCEALNEALEDSNHQTLVDME